MSKDAGSASVLVIAAGALLSVVAVAVGVVATGLAAHRQAVRAADLAALAGAQHSLTDQAVACQVARDVALANGARLDSCLLQSDALRVGVTVSTLALLPRIEATARAGVRVS
jgi:secretion/DNA translocation related TadE-like protein